MKILIICTHFPPDTNIAANRPYFFAKYLSEFGHDVTVLCSGVITGRKNNKYDESLNKFKVITYLKEKTNQTPKQSTSTFAHRNSGVIPEAVRDMVKDIYHYMCEPLTIYKIRKKNNYHYQNIKKAIDKLRDEHFDVVFSTFNELSNIYGGYYAKKLYGAKWVLDFRDRLVQLSHLSWLWNTLHKPVEKRYINRADAVTSVSEDLFYGTSYPSTKIHTIYNGFEPLEMELGKIPNKRQMSFCYTGMVYGQRAIALESLFKTLFRLKNQGLIDVSNVSFEYAGQSAEDVYKIASNYGLDSIINQHGYLLPVELNQLQCESDVFLVLSWNHENERGILTGKFYDGVRVKRPILSIITGETPDSELYRLNEKYHYGFCYEQARDNQQDKDFEQFILDIYNQKIQTGCLNYQVNESLFEKFKYENMTKELETLCNSLISK